MKRNKSFFCQLILIGVIIFTSGCEKFLTESNPSSITIDNYYTLPEHAESAVNAIYEDTRTVYNGGGFSGSAWLMLEFATGLTNTVTLGAAGPTNSSIRLLNINSDNTYLNTFWNSYYRGIANANLAIEKIPQIDMDQSRKALLMGEAHFFRAFYYFNLVRIFGKVPLILETMDKSSPLLFPHQSDIDDVYAAIVEDLLIAEQAPLPMSSASGRTSKGAVKSLLSSVYLTMAGYPLNKGQEYYVKARDKSYEVIQSGAFRLFTDYASLKTDATKNSGEHIFMVQYSGDIVNRNAFQEIMLPYSINISLFASETGMLSPVEEFLNTYEADDKRTQEKEFYYRKYSLVNDRANEIDLGGWHIFKWMDEVANTQTALCGMNWPLLRYAEVLLIFAEADNEVNGPTDDGYAAVNLIRERAELNDLSGLTQQSFREAIWLEKIHEMSYENKTWFDMVRTRKVLDLNTKNFSDLVGSTYIYGAKFAERNLLFPIPTAEMMNNTNLIQNNGY